MRSRQLEAALSEFLAAAAAYLRAEVAAGAEVPFELGAQGSRGGRGGTPLYCYRALTGAFIAERDAAIKRLPGHAQAAKLLEGFDGLDRYLASVSPNGERAKGRARVRAAIKALLDDVFDEQTDFELRPERLHAALERLEQSALASSGEVTIVATLHGLTIASPELALTKGLTIAQPDALRGVPDAALAPEEGELLESHLLVVHAFDDDGGPDALARGREVLSDLLRALRLFGDGRLTLGALAWVRAGVGPWSPLAMGAGGRPHGMLVVAAEQEDELRAFCNLVSRRAPDGDELAWALRRFELGCERASAAEALTDNLLALRALLEPEGSSSGLLAGRLAALCATPEHRTALNDRVLQAVALERELIAGVAPARRGGAGLAEELAGHLRALLRDVICGHLSADLAGIADELLLSAGACELPASAELAGSDETAESPDAPESAAHADPGETADSLDTAEAAAQADSEQAESGGAALAITGR